MVECFACVPVTDAAGALRDEGRGGLAELRKWGLTCHTQQCVPPWKKGQIAEDCIPPAAAVREGPI